MKLKMYVMLLSLSCMFWVSHAGSQAKIGLQEQAHFSAEDEAVKSPVSIPEDAMSILRKDSSVLDVLAEQNRSADQLPTSWFTASLAHLDGNGEGDLVVVGEGPLQGANVTTFWVFLRRPQGLRLVLSVTAHDLLIVPARSKGYKNIEILSATAVRMSKVIFRFDGNQYRAVTHSAPRHR